jgi:Rad3-related DNA helicase
MVRRYVERSEGRAMVLFTSIASLARVAADLGGWCATTTGVYLQCGLFFERGVLQHHFDSADRQYLMSLRVNLG